jgi:hypothetical protein
VQDDVMTDHFACLVGSEQAIEEVVPHIALRYGHHVSGLDEFCACIKVCEFPKYFEGGICAIHCNNLLRVCYLE